MLFKLYLKFTIRYISLQGGHEVEVQQVVMTHWVSVVEGRGNPPTSCKDLLGFVMGGGRERKAPNEL